MSRKKDWTREERERNLSHEPGSILMRAMGDIDESYIMEADPEAAGIPLKGRRHAAEAEETADTHSIREDTPAVKDNRITFRKRLTLISRIAAACLIFLVGFGIWRSSNIRLAQAPDGASSSISAVAPASNEEAAKDAAPNEEAAKDAAQNAALSSGNPAAVQETGGAGLSNALTSDNSDNTGLGAAASDSGLAAAPAELAADSLDALNENEAAEMAAEEMAADEAPAAPTTTPHAAGFDSMVFCGDILEAEQVAGISFLAPEKEAASDSDAGASSRSVQEAEYAASALPESSAASETCAVTEGDAASRIFATDGVIRIETLDSNGNILSALTMSTQDNLVASSQATSSEIWEENGYYYLQEQFRK